ncbi:hypothetical protein DICSQDRAFT_149907 [Dichomitus squalens LYAD-421 SS1]|uniref:Uncharacterized protein n=1 Tax=Dichomitus squalens (strain LYAD-421) TaxID=732165 RepID=R7SMB9_DICSQ|nr:uncharacterized protein DICSQDRAFT_149907 [Dichomitus squalens LYAD-421 SS1]EJF57271.1 hypothetical protein DICSQDRAFT_149907 [Dichomitus squalens LYAD-421 SS1]
MARDASLPSSVRQNALASAILPAFNYSEVASEVASILQAISTVVPTPSRFPDSRLAFPSLSIAPLTALPSAPFTPLVQHAPSAHSSVLHKRETDTSDTSTSTPTSTTTVVVSTTSTDTQLTTSTHVATLPRDKTVTGPGSTVTTTVTRGSQGRTYTVETIQTVTQTRTYVVELPTVVIVTA